MRLRGGKKAAGTSQNDAVDVDTRGKAVMEKEQEHEEKEEAQEEEEQKKTELEEGFYEIETIRRRRVRKGQPQYLIKWLGWPESANTWEPLENLQSCLEVVDAFIESLSSRKPSCKPSSSSSRKRKGKSGGSSSLSVPEKKQTRHATRATSAYNLTAGLPELSAPTRTPVREGESVAMPPPPSSSQEANASEGNNDELMHSKVDNNAEAVQSERPTGARRRKSGTVRRCEPNLAAAPTIGVADEPPRPPPRSFDFGSSSNTVSRNANPIVKIIKAVNFSASVADNAQDVELTFAALRADGSEVRVTNRFLRANVPMLLIDYYEQRLIYNSSQQAPGGAP